MRRILMTGFDAFGGESINPSYEAVMQMPDHIGDFFVIKRKLPTVFYRSREVLKGYLLQLEPDVVLCVGQAGGRSRMSVERVAINCMDASIPDNEGNVPVDEMISSGGPAAYFATVPIKRITAAMNEAGVPAEVSNTAGTYVCNQVLYGLMDDIVKLKLNILAGFIHVPYIPQQTSQYAVMELRDIVKGLTAAVRTL